MLWGLVKSTVKREHFSKFENPLLVAFILRLKAVVSRRLERNSSQRNYRRPSLVKEFFFLRFCKQNCYKRSHFTITKTTQLDSSTYNISSVKKKKGKICCYPVEVSFLPVNLNGALLINVKFAKPVASLGASLS